jgi:phytoene synthase
MSDLNRDDLQTTLAARSDIQKGSKSFSFASLVFSRREREACWRLYAWCRRSDDAIDGAATYEEARSRLDELKTKTRAAFRGEDIGEHPWTGLKEVAVRYKVSEQAAMDLLRGFEVDLGDVNSKNGILVQMKSWDDLADYCYCVAGTVGLMMCPIMGVKNPEAAKAAVAMGSAMQLTNISRDVREDFERGRVYLPEDWLILRGVKPHELLNPENRKAVFSVVQQMLDKAEDMYAMGEAGLRFLPWRAAWAVLVAAFVYREIGRKVLAKGSETDFHRVVVGRGKKAILFFQATIQLLKWRLVGYGPDRIESMKGQTNGINILPS